MSREELENMTVEEFEQLFNTIFGIEHVSYLLFD